jgi:hypothetical protein
MRPLPSRQVQRRHWSDHGRCLHTLPGRHLRTHDLWLLCDFELRLRKILRPRCSTTLVCICVDTWLCPRGIFHPARVQCVWRAAWKRSRDLQPSQFAVSRRRATHIEYRNEWGPDDRGGGALHGNRTFCRLGDDPRVANFYNNGCVFVQVQHNHKFSVCHSELWKQDRYSQRIYK